MRIFKGFRWRVVLVVFQENEFGIYGMCGMCQDGVIRNAKILVLMKSFEMVEMTKEIKERTKKIGHTPSLSSYGCRLRVSREVCQAPRQARPGAPHNKAKRQ